MKVLVLCFIIFLGVVIFRVADYRRVPPSSNIDMVRQLYRKVNTTIPSTVSAKQYENTIRKRLECYLDNSDYIKRIGLCNTSYEKSIIKEARNSLASRPEMGLFVNNITLCPVMYNMCIGNQNNDIERCIIFERQCIDHTLDTYWRGSSLYTEQQYRTEQ